MLRLRHTLSACMLATALLASLPVHAATYYVATTGNNSNPGTSSSPWRTVTYAVSKMVAGDTTYVKGGVYSEGMVRFGTSGTQSAPIKLLNAPGQFPVIACKKDGKANMVLLSNKAGSTKPIGWITIEGFEIRDCYNGIKFSNLHNSTIRRNWIHHSWGGSGIFGWATKVVIDRNKINANATSSGGHGIYTNGSYYTITNNLIYDNGTFGIQLNGSGSSAYDASRHAGQAYADSNNWTISNNTFAYQRTKAGIVVWGSRCNNARIENNIFYENAVKGSSSIEQGISFCCPSTCTGLVIRNNLAYASGSGGTKFLGSGGNYTQSGNIVNSTDPKFSNAPATLPSSPNFALASGSPAVNKGLTTSATKTSYTNVSRPQLSLYDIGAFEFISSSASLSAPTSLQVAN